MMTPARFLQIADLFMQGTDITRETTLSHRMFGDTKKLARLRDGGDLTLTRCCAALDYMAARWPADTEVPAHLAAYLELRDPPRVSLALVEAAE